MTDYEQDVSIWSDEQSRLLRAGQFDRLDLVHLAVEIAEVGRGEQRELAGRMTALLILLLKWRFQPERRSRGRQQAIRVRRQALMAQLAEVPSLRTTLDQPFWWSKLWADAVADTMDATGLDGFPEHCPWNAIDILDGEWLPE